MKRISSVNVQLIYILRNTCLECFKRVSMLNVCRALS